MALLIGTAIALWLIVRPPGSSNGSEVVVVSGTPTSAVTSTARTSTPRSTTPPASETQQPAATQVPPTDTPPGPRTYVVQEGDTLLSIAEENAPPGVDFYQYAAQIADASGLSSIDEDIAAGDTLTLP